MPFTPVTASDPVAPLENILNTRFTELDNSITSAFDDYAIKAYRWANASERADETGMIVADRGYQADNGVTYRYNGAAWIAWDSSWITWATAPSDLSVGSGGSSSVQRYAYTGGRVLFQCKYVLGSSGASVGAAPAINLPFNVIRPITRFPALLGTGSYFDASTLASAYLVNPRLTLLTANQVMINTYNGAYGTINSTTPWTWAVGDELYLEFWADPA